VKGERELSVVRVDMVKGEITQAAVLGVSECNTVFSECLMVHRVKDEDDLEVVEVLCTSNVEIEDNLYKREIKAITIPVSYY
jgi:hypothetical protein